MVGIVALAFRLTEYQRIAVGAVSIAGGHKYAGRADASEAMAFDQAEAFVAEFERRNEVTKELIHRERT